MNIIFVCTGNICRSPMAEGYFKHLCKLNSRNNILIQSAGINAASGMPPSLAAVKVMSDFDIDINSHSSQTLSIILINWADIIIVMSKAHKNSIKMLFPEYECSRIFLLNEFNNLHEDIYDPYGGNLDIYQKCFQNMKKPLDNLIKHIDKLKYK
ncbi:MAG TPA: low molecular weight protein arginine phosphatase [Victivallales bacterium]|nr:low molecular weight protein arginine phosphatase [Victivallales bacterium]